MSRGWAYRRSSRFFLVGFDLLVIVTTLSVLHAWRVAGSSFLTVNTPTLWFFALTLLATVYVFGAYEVERFQRKRDAFSRIGVATLFFTAFASLLIYLGVGERSGLFGRGVLIGSLFTFFIVSGLTRWVLFKSLHSLQKKSLWIFIVSQRWAERLRKDLKTSRFNGRIVFLDESNLSEMPKQLKAEQGNVVVGLERNVFETNSELFMQVLEARLHGHAVMDLTAFYEKFWLKIPVQTIAPEWLVQAEGFKLFQAPVRLKVKRLFDLALSTALLAVTWPLMLLAALAVRLESPGDILFRQTRTGRHGEPFTIFKFRSMCKDAEKNGAQWSTVGDARITRVGHFLRKSRIDELPQIFNVFKGEMSFVGPRPERPEFNENLEKDIPFYKLRHLVSPGITGWAQVLYPYGASAEDSWEKLQYDIFYIKNYSFWLDLKIALKTARVVILGRGR